jgi:uncharacterized membrane protein YgcG
MGTPIQRSSHKQRGTVMVLALIIVTLVIVLVADATQVARMEREASRNAATDLRIEAAMSGALEIAKAYLTDDLINSGETDSLIEEWALEEGLEREFDPESTSGMALGAGPASDATDEFPRARIFIEDEERKWPLPWLRMGSDSMRERRRDGLATVLDDFRANTPFDLEPALAQNYAQRISEFINRKEGDTGFGPTPRPLTKTGLPLHVLDLGLIPGIPHELLYRQVDPESGTVVAGLMDVVTLWSDGKINVNTASLAVLRGVFRRREDDMSVANDIIKRRDGMQEEYELQENTRDLSPEERRQRRREERAAEERNSGNPLASGGRESGSASGGGRSSGGNAANEASGAFTSMDQLKKEVNTLTDRLYTEIATTVTLQSKVFSIWVEIEVGGMRKVRRTILRREGPRFVMILSENADYPTWRQLSEDEYRSRLSASGLADEAAPAKGR